MEFLIFLRLKYKLLTKIKKIMKKLSIFLVSCALLLSSCAKDFSNPALSKVDRGELKNLPEWVFAPDVDNGVAGVGIAPGSRGGFRVQIKKAEMDARANIATRIQSEISRITKDAIRESDLNGVNDVEQVFTEATKEVVKNMLISGAVRTDIYKGTDKTLYIRMVLKDKDYSRYLRNSENVYKARLRAANLGKENLDKSQAAVKVLFDELDAERNKE